MNDSRLLLIKRPGTIFRLTCVNLLASDGSGKFPSHFMSGQLLGTRARAFATQPEAMLCRKASLVNLHMVPCWPMLIALLLMASWLAASVAIVPIIFFRPVTGMGACRVPSIILHNPMAPKQSPISPGRRATQSLYLIMMSCVSLDLIQECVASVRLPPSLGKLFPPNALKLCSAY